MKHDLKQYPIVFMTREENAEAMKWGAVNAMYQTADYPMIQWIGKDGVTYQSNKTYAKNNIWSKERYIKLLQKSVMWADIREDFKPKPWYECPENIGKPIWISDTVKDDWAVGIFTAYSKGAQTPFQTEAVGWRFAKLITLEDIEYEGVKDDGV